MVVTAKTRTLEEMDADSRALVREVQERRRARDLEQGIVRGQELFGFPIRLDERLVSGPDLEFATHGEPTRVVEEA